MPDPGHPGVYIEEISSRRPGIQSVPTSIPVFIGYTEKAQDIQPGDLLHIPRHVRSLREFIQCFGAAPTETGISVDIDDSTSPPRIDMSLGDKQPFHMYNAIQAFFNNEGKTCLVISVGGFNGGSVDLAALLGGLEIAGQVDGITLNVFPDGQGLPTAQAYYQLVTESMRQCQKLRDRFTLIDVWAHRDGTDDIQFLRNALPSSRQLLQFGAAYYPPLEMDFHVAYNPEDVTVNGSTSGSTLHEIEGLDHNLYNMIKQRISMTPVVMQPSGAIAGIYAQVDTHRGVWKAPANVNVARAIKPVVHLTDSQQQALNIDVVAGKSVNAIRTFPGRGVLVWGGRTLAGNDNEWRYVSVRRFCMMVEESTVKGTRWAVFEPNNASTWAQLETMVANFLTIQWRNGALQGAKPEQAFFVNVGLGKTMTQNDILEGRLIVEIGMAVVRPAEFIILRFSHKMQQA